MSWFFVFPWDLISLAAKPFNLDKLVVGSIVMAESRGEITAIRHEPKYRWLYNVDECARAASRTVAEETRGQMTSYGYMQVMGAVAREYGFDGEFDDLLSELSLEYGCRHFAAKLTRYGTIADAIAAYNAGSPRRVSGEYENQDYVNRVMGYYRQLAKAAACGA